MVNITYLSNDILSLLIAYIGNDRFLDISAKLYNEKKHLRYISLKRKKSIKYYLDEDYRRKILTLIDNPLKQLSLYLCCCNIKDVSPLANVHSLNLSGCNEIIDISSLENIYSLNLTSCKKIRDVSKLRNVHILNLSFTNIKDVSALGNIDTLFLSYCKKITNVSALGNVRILHLNGCNKIKDVSMLGNVYTLNLTYTNIIDVFTLQNIPFLYLDPVKFHVI